MTRGKSVRAAVFSKPPYHNDEPWLATAGKLAFIAIAADVAFALGRS